MLRVRVCLAFQNFVYRIYFIPGKKIDRLSVVDWNANEQNMAKTLDVNDFLYEKIVFKNQPRRINAEMRFDIFMVMFLAHCKRSQWKYNWKYHFSVMLHIQTVLLLHGKCKIDCNLSVETASTNTMCIERGKKHQHVSSAAHVFRSCLIG